MSKAADSDSTLRKHRQRGLIPWKPGQSGNAKGRPRGSRNKLTEEFISDLCESWKTYGKSALMTAAMTAPLEYVRVVASLMPRDVDVTVSNIKAERMSSSEIRSLIAEYRGAARDTLEADRDPDGVFKVGET
jgi:hypothetical protein